MKESAAFRMKVAALKAEAKTTLFNNIMQTVRETCGDTDVAPELLADLDKCLDRYLAIT